MPTITLPDTYDQKLKLLVMDPFEETRESILKDLIDAELQRRRIEPRTEVVKTMANLDVIQLDPGQPGNLVHTKVVAATVDGQELHRPKWNGIREWIHVLALKQLGSFEALQQASDARLRAGKFEDDGFKYIPDGDFSIQGVDANLSWAQSLKLVKMIGISLSLEIVWREKEGAAHPGKTGSLQWIGQTQR